MKTVFWIVGVSCSGKSYYNKLIAKIFGLKIVHLDVAYNFINRGFSKQQSYNKIFEKRAESIIVIDGLRPFVFAEDMECLINVIKDYEIKYILIHPTYDRYLLNVKIRNKDNVTAYAISEEDFNKENNILKSKMIDFIEINNETEIYDKLTKSIISNYNIDYHYFETLKIGNPVQRSLEKYNKFNLDNIIVDKRCLDIGCNTGYNCIKMAYTALNVEGIDIAGEPIRIAEKINTLYFHHNNIKFIEYDVFKYSQESQFDIILASSIFHYFVGLQQLFIDKCYDLLTESGILVLECGILTDIKPQRIDCEYTSRLKLLELCKAFELVYEGLSVLQNGDNIQRYVFQFKKL